MQQIERDTHPEFIRGSSLTYLKAVTLIKPLWERLFGKEMPRIPGSPSSRYIFVLAALELQLKRSARPDSTVKSLSIEDVPPSIFLQSCYEVVDEILEENLEIDVPMRIFLRRTLDKVSDYMLYKRRINIVNNSNFSRMFQYLKEVEENTRLSEDWQLRVMNAGGKGPVAWWPAGPDGLKVRLLSTS